MKLSHRLSALLGSMGFLFLAAPCAIHGQPEILKVPPKDWKYNEVLRLSVEKWPAAKNGPKATKPIATYMVDVRHLTNPTRDDLWWIVKFEPFDSAPKILRAPGSAWILRDKGWISKASLGDAEREEREVLSFKEASVLVKPFEGIPAELVVPAEPVKRQTDKATLEILREDDGDSIIMVAVIKVRGQDKVQITQIWKKGECWWREYTREINGRKDLHAKFVGVLSIDQWGKDKALRADYNAFVCWDKRLTVNVTLPQEHPKLSDIVNLVEKATGVTLTLDDSLRGYEPDFGACFFRDCPAWVLVNFIASHGYHKARWEEHKGGLRLKSANPMTDAGLKKLAGVEDLTSLNLFSTQVTNAGLKELASLKDLTTLDLAHTKITDAGLKELAGLKNLTALDLDSTKVTDAGLKALSGLKKLNTLRLSRTRVTVAGVAELRKILPGCQISR